MKSRRDTASFYDPTSFQDRLGTVSGGGHGPAERNGTIGVSERGNPRSESEVGYASIIEPSHSDPVKLPK